MGFNNLIQLSFSEEELTQLNAAFAEINTILKAKSIPHLTPSERQKYGRIAEQNKLFVNKAKGYMEQYPELVPTFVDKTHFDEDYVSRGIVENFLQRVHNIDEQIGDAKILLDHDNYQDAISFYRHIRYLANENSPGMTSVYKDMQQFFKNSPINGDDTEPTKKE